LRFVEEVGWAKFARLRETLGRKRDEGGAAFIEEGFEDLPNGLSQGNSSSTRCST
tara:strand:+ start:105 stop:269 length:165 start_codon:yes stop_codon:yes gene_type:complete